MGRLERLYLWRALCGAVLLLCLALFAAGARAAVPAMEEARPAVAMIPMTVSHAMAGALDCVLCAGCYIAPAPTTHGFSGECQEPEEPAWRVHATSPPDSFWMFDMGGRHVRLPVRIAYCRWLN